MKKLLTLGVVISTLTLALLLPQANTQISSVSSNDFQITSAPQLPPMQKS